MNLENYFKSALCYETYVELLDENRPLHELHYRRFNVDDRIAQEAFLKNTYNILVITEPWCGDSLALVPLIRKLSEKTDTWKLRILLRDENPELMSKFLTKGARAIPLFLFLDENYKLITKWGPRPKSAQKIFENHSEQIKSGQTTKTEVIKKIRSFYAKDRGKKVFAELKSILNNVSTMK